jgi:hypothetical protein
MPAVLTGGQRTPRNEVTGLWHYVGRLSFILVVLAALYTLYVVAFRSESFLDGKYTLFATLLSVFAAPVIKRGRRIERRRMS